MRLTLRTPIAAIACVLCTGVLAEERPAAPDDRSPSALTAPFVREALDDERLGQLRGRLATPADLTQQAGVVLWDEPRKSLPPLRTGAEAGHSANVTTTFTIHRAP